MIEDLHRRYHADLVKALRRQFGGHRDGLEDAVQSAFVRFSELEDRGAVANPRAFLLVMARNLVLNQIARSGVMQRNVEQETRAPSAPVVEEKTPETVLLERERFAILNQAILSLPEEQRELLMLSRIEGMTYGEISKLTGRSPADISRQIARALSALQSRLSAGASGSDPS